ncbi:FtsW/RodA/SpoVE family cell cycle protein [Niallia sp. NCCP-28]|uniref:FtsW/RodA/SpoVE family cell cycle protein n=1 Tax=Niallia sp. NCCP-28 TaxID=2934712 RepID=UPI0020858D64|nr:FtsW/RodA/SpoVE family cell cycle protein [Niallia sp. NCCP-28]GKU82201.1 cell division protein FtsW [Niallia sp. NCCP-28]
MQEKKESFLKDVITQIKSKEAKIFIEKELSMHIKANKISWMKKGLKEHEAEEKAVRQMGNPLQLGRDLNKLHRPKIDWVMIGLLFAAFGFGFLPLFVMGEEYDSISLIGNKIMQLLFGVGIAVSVMLFDYRKLEKWWMYFYLIGCGILLCLKLFPGVMINGYTYLLIATIPVNGFYALPFLFLGWAGILNQKKLKVWQFISLLLFSLVLFNMSNQNIVQIMMYLIMVCVMLWWSVLGRKQVIWITGISASFFSISIIQFLLTAKEYQLRRLRDFLHPESSSDAGFIYLKIKEVLANAKWFGSSKIVSIPGRHTDFAFISIINGYGYIIGVWTILVLILFLWRMGKILNLVHVQDSYAKLLVIGGMVLYLIPVAYNFGMILGVFPIISIYLPFVSYGNLPLLLHSIGIGVMLSIYRRKDLQSKAI